MYNNPSLFRHKRVCELGSGLGLVSILLHKMKVCKSIVVTDGDEDTIELLNDNVVCTLDPPADGTANVNTETENIAIPTVDSNSKLNSLTVHESDLAVRKLWWDEDVDVFLRDIQTFIADKQTATPESSHVFSAVVDTKDMQLFDVVIGADIIYEEEQISPLLKTVIQIMSSKFDLL